MSAATAASAEFIARPPRAMQNEWTPDLLDRHALETPVTRRLSSTRLNRLLTADGLKGASDTAVRSP